MHLPKWAALLIVFWLLLSGYFQPLLLTFGIVSVFVVLLALKRMDAADQEPKSVGSGIEIIRYLGWLIRQIIHSSLQVTKLIWSPSRELTPSLSKIQISRVQPACHVLYANSITLTPGTLSVDLLDDEIIVHALQQSSIEALKQGGMEKKISHIWGEK